MPGVSVRDAKGGRSFVGWVEERNPTGRMDLLGFAIALPNLQSTQLRTKPNQVCWICWVSLSLYPTYNIGVAIDTLSVDKNYLSC